MTFIATHHKFFYQPKKKRKITVFKFISMLLALITMLKNNILINPATDFLNEKGFLYDPTKAGMFLCFHDTKQ